MKIQNKLKVLCIGLLRCHNVCGCYVRFVAALIKIP